MVRNKAVSTRRSLLPLGLVKPLIDEDLNFVVIITPKISVGLLDSTFIHHPRSESLYGVYKDFAYVDGCYTSALQLVTAALSTNDRVDGFDLRS